MKQAVFTIVPVTRRKKLVQQLKALSEDTLKLTVTHCGLSRLQIPKLALLQSLNLTSNKLTCENLHQLLIEPIQLTELVLANNTALGSAVSKLVNSQRKLRLLDLSNCSLSGDIVFEPSDLQILNLNKNHKLVSVEVKSQVLSTLSFADTATAKIVTADVKSMDCSRTPFIDIGRYSSLQELSCEGVQLQVAFFDYLNSNKHLTRLNIAHGRLSGQVSPRPSSIKQLNIDWLVAPNFTFIQLWPISVLFASHVDGSLLTQTVMALKSKLKFFIAETSQLSQSHLIAMAASAPWSQLEQLSFRGNMPCKHISGFPTSLTRLSLPRCVKFLPLPERVEQLWLEFDLFTKYGQHFNKECTLSNLQLEYGLSDQDVLELGKGKLRKLVGIRDVEIAGVTVVEDELTEQFCTWPVL